MSWTELRDFVDALPEDSATKAALAGDREGRRWSQESYLLAFIANLLGLLIRIQWAAGRLKGKAPDLPTVSGPDLDRPPNETTGQRAQLLAQMARYRPRSPSPEQGDLASFNDRLRARSG
jgi:hypothetical protein